ncbi:hypothetical protein HPB52_014502 [Rhipicephalus sanguineus]|uniref:Uncharacterized protein n=1 Tax=Rhipicephalus sanguineus TaxID=34632 RepID=A0A9D4Q2U3_RHISA|nr:hypothetical protein HPB52_014502 [Rhipicephalus sanguineus]
MSSSTKKRSASGVEAIQVGGVLRAIAHGLRATGQRQQGEESQGQQYFFYRILKAVGELAKGVGNVVQGAAEGIGNAVNALTFSDTKGVVTTKAADILHKLVIKDLSLYASEDDKTYKDFRQHIADDLSHVAESLIKKGEGLLRERLS